MTIHKVLVRKKKMASRPVALQHFTASIRRALGGALARGGEETLGRKEVGGRLEGEGELLPLSCEHPYFRKKKREGRKEVRFFFFSN